MGGSANPGMTLPTGGQNQFFGNQAMLSPNQMQPMNRTTGFLPPVQPTPQQNPFQQAAAAQNDALGITRGGANMVNNATGFVNQGANMVNQGTNYLTGGANVVGSGANMIGAGSQMIGQGQNIVGDALGAMQPGMDRTNMGMTETAASGMANYQNPYEDAVVQKSMRDIGNQGLQLQNTLGAQAQKAGAFGGSRHGIAEAELAKGTQQQMLDQAAKLRAQGFNTALGAAQADRTAQLGAAGQSANMAGQMAGMGGQISGMGSAMGGLGSQMVGAGGQLGNFGTAMGNLGSTMGNFGSTMGNLGSTASGIGTNLSNLGQTSFGYGQSIQDKQMQQGLMDQQIMQGLIDAGKSQYGGYTGQPTSGLNTMLQTLSAQPSMTGQTSQFQPGLFNYLQLGAQMMPT